MTKAAGREIVGLKVAFYHPQAGARKEDDSPERKAHFNMKDLQPAEEYIKGKSAFNCVVEKCKCAVNITPQMRDADGNVTDLLEGDPENKDMKVGYYAVILDGKKFVGDAIGAETPIEVNGTDRNFGLVPICVFGPELEERHTLGFEVEVNGFVEQTDSVLQLNN